MKTLTMVQIFSAILIASLTLYFYIEKQNDLTELRMEIPALQKELKRIEENNIRLQYEIDQFESPVHLMELARKPEFSHLKYPRLNEVIILREEP
jgi:cell division protein FtsB